MTPDDLEKHPVGGDLNDMADDPLLRELRSVREAIDQEQQHRSAAFEAERAAREDAIEDEAGKREANQRKVRRRILAIGAVVVIDLLLSLGVIQTQHRQDAADKRAEAIRVESRRNLCEFINTGIERDRKSTEALITISNEPDPTRPPRTPEQQARAQQAIRSYVSLQGMRFDGGHVIAATVDCNKFALDPANTRPEFPKEGK